MTPPPFHPFQKKPRLSEAGKGLAAATSGAGDRSAPCLLRSIPALLVLTLGIPVSGLANPCTYDLGIISFSRTRMYQQAASAAMPATLIDSQYYRASLDFSPSPDLGTTLAVEEATWTDPLGVPRLLTPLPLSPGAFSAGEPFDSQEALDANIPVGSHQFLLTTSKGPLLLPLTIPADRFPVPASAANFDALQKVVPGRDLVLALAPTPLEAAILHQLSVMLVDSSLPSPIVLSQTLPWSAKGATITFPARILEPDRNYTCTLFVQKVVLFNRATAKTTAGQTACLGSLVQYQSLTEIPLKTLPLPPTPPRLSLRVELDPARAIIEITALPGQRLRLEAASDPRSWTSLLETNVTEAKVQHVEPLRPDDGVRMFRAVYP